MTRGLVNRDGVDALIVLAVGVGLTRGLVVAPGYPAHCRSGQGAREKPLFPSAPLVPLQIVLVDQTCVIPEQRLPYMLYLHGNAGTATLLRSHLRLGLLNIHPWSFPASSITSRKAALRWPL